MGLVGFVVLMSAMLFVRGQSETHPPAGPSAAWDQAHSELPEDPTVADDELVVLTTASAVSRRLADERQLDPTQDGWESEAVAEEVKQTLLKLLGAIHDASSVGEQSGGLDQIVSDDFAASTLRPPVIKQFADAVTTVLVQASPDDDETQAMKPTELRAALEPLIELTNGASSLHPHVKVVRVELARDEVKASAFIEVDGQLSDGVIAFQANWDCVLVHGQGEGLQLKSIQVRDYREVTSTVGDQRTWFVDATQAVLGKTDAFQQQLAFGLNHWLERLERVHGMHAFARWGLAVGDVNGDELDDVYICQPGGLPNRLFLREPDGTATERAREFGVDYLDHCSSALLVDLDNDGDQDLVLTTPSGLLVMSNEGGSRFELQTTLTTGDTDFMSLSACDYDDDGDLDVYACIEFPQRRATSGELRVDFVYHEANDGAANALFRNEVVSGKSWEFVDVTGEVGLDVNNRRHSLAAAWEDFDNDGDQDLYVANDYGQNCLYRNRTREPFAEMATSRNVVDSASGMSVSWGDYNHDGWMDLYVANMFSSAGSRITRQQQFKPGESAASARLIAGSPRGTRCFRIMRRQFHRSEPEADVEMGTVGLESACSRI